MKNNLLVVDLDKAYSVDERLPSYNDLLEIIVTNKIQRGDFDDLAEEMTTIFGSDCDCFCDEDCEFHENDCNREVLIGRRMAECEDSNARKLLSAGYTDCMDEAIRFLVEEENISPEHPVIRNLKAHLEQSKDQILETISQLEPQRYGLDIRCYSRVPGLEAVSFHEFLENSTCSWNAG